MVITPVSLLPGVVLRCRDLGMLQMTDEAGGDAKLLAVPVEKVCGLYAYQKTYKDVSPWRLEMISHFFEHYKDLDKGKWVKIEGWVDIDEAHKEIMDGVTRYNSAE